MIWIVLVALALAAGALVWSWRVARMQTADAWAERVRLEAQVQALQNSLLSTTRLASLGNLVAGLVHEINTPMGALKSNHDVLMRALQRLQGILEDEVVEPHELEEVRRIVRALNEIISVNNMAVERVTGLVKNLRNFGRPDRAEFTYADLHEGLDSTVVLARHELGGRIEVVREYGDLPAVLCRAQQLNQVWLNLLVNACHSIRGQGTITIRTENSVDHVTVCIADTGCGIPEANRLRIFEPGFTTKGERIGMGMGLLISRQIIEQHGGSISVDSEVDRGTTFTVTIPIRSAPIEVPAIATQLGG